MTLPAGIYLRISRDSEGLGSGSNAARRLRAARQAAGLVGRRALRGQRRERHRGKPARLRADDARRRGGRIKAVVVWDVDRLTRTPRELEDVIDHADRLGLSSLPSAGDIDLATEQGRMMARMKGTVARYEVEQQRRRLKAKHRRARDQRDSHRQAPLRLGLPPGPHAGHQPRRSRHRPGVRRSRALRSGALEDLQRPEPSRHHHQYRKPWQTVVLRQMLLRWRNCGVRTHLGKEVGPRAVGADHRPAHPRTRRALLTDPGRRSNNRGTEPKYLLTLDRLCGVCGGPLVGTNEYTYVLKNGRTRVYPHSYTCAHAGCMKVRRRMADVDRPRHRSRPGRPQARRRPPARRRPHRRGPRPGPHRCPRGQARPRRRPVRRRHHHRRPAPPVSERLKPQLAEERARLAAAQPNPELADFTGDRRRSLEQGRRRDAQARHPPPGDAHHRQPHRLGQRPDVRPRIRPDRVAHSGGVEAQSWNLTSTAPAGSLTVFVRVLGETPKPRRSPRRRRCRRLAWHVPRRTRVPGGGGPSYASGPQVWGAMEMLSGP